MTEIQKGGQHLDMQVGLIPAALAVAGKENKTNAQS